MNKLASGTYRGFSWYERIVNSNYSIILAVSNADLSEYLSLPFLTNKVNAVGFAHKWIDTILAGGY